MRSIALDLTDFARVAAFAGALEAGLGRLDIGVTNSRGHPSNLFKNTKPEDCWTTIDQLVMSTIYFAEEAFPRMQKYKWGQLIAVTSPAVKQRLDGSRLSNSLRTVVTGPAPTLASEDAVALSLVRSLL